jgi:hypothetical protein
VEVQPTGVVEQGVATPSRILVFDVETSYMLAKTFTTKPDYIRHKQIKHGWFMHCWAAQWHGEKKVYGDRQTSEEAIAKDDMRIAGSLAAMVRLADVVLAHNGDNFDIPKLRNRLIVSNQEPLGPVDSIDTLKIARKLGFTHNNLDGLGIELGVGSKIKTDEELWDGAYEGNDLALQQMLKYCKQDVVLLDGVYSRLKPHAVTLKRLAHGEGSFCPYCGGTKYQRRGFRSTNAGRFPQYQCTNCLRYYRDKAGDAGKSQMRPL